MPHSREGGAGQHGLLRFDAASHGYDGLSTIANTIAFGVSFHHHATRIYLDNLVLTIEVP